MREIILIVVLQVAVVFAQVPAEFKTKSGNVYTGVVATEVNVEYLKVVHGGGVAKVPHWDVPDEVMKKLAPDLERVKLAAAEAALYAGETEDTEAKKVRDWYEAYDAVHEIQVKVLEQRLDGVLVERLTQRKAVNLKVPAFVYGVKGKKVGALLKLKVARDGFIKEPSRQTYPRYVQTTGKVR